MKVKLLIILSSLVALEVVARRPGENPQPSRRAMKRRDTSEFDTNFENGNYILWRPYVEGSCVGNCGRANISVGNCACDYHCISLGHCCEDFKDVCRDDVLQPYCDDWFVVANRSENNQPSRRAMNRRDTNFEYPQRPDIHGSCMGNCNLDDVTGNCWCNYNCISAGDCCEDFKAECQEDTLKPMCED